MSQFIVIIMEAKLHVYLVYPPWCWHSTKEIHQRKLHIFRKSTVRQNFRTPPTCLKPDVTPYFSEFSSCVIRKHTRTHARARTHTYTPTHTHTHTPTHAHTHTHPHTHTHTHTHTPTHTHHTHTPHIHTHSGKQIFYLARICCMLTPTKEHPLHKNSTPSTPQKKLPVLWGTQTFIPVCTTAWHWPVPWSQHNKLQLLPLTV